MPRAPNWRDTPPAYSHALGDVSPSAICGVTPGIVGAPLSGRVGPPLAKNQSKTEPNGLRRRHRRRRSRTVDAGAAIDELPGLRVAARRRRIGHRIGNRRDILRHARRHAPRAAAGRIPDDAEPWAPGAVLRDDVPRLIGSVVLVEADADVGRQAIAHTPRVVDEHGVGAEARAFALQRESGSTGSSWCRRRGRSGRCRSRPAPLPVRIAPALRIR